MLWSFLSTCLHELLELSRCLCRCMETREGTEQVPGARGTPLGATLPVTHVAQALHKHEYLRLSR